MCVKSLIARVLLSHAFSGELQAMSIMNEAVQDSVAQGWVTEHDRVPLFLSGSCLTLRSLTRIIFFLGAGLRC